MGLIGNGGVHAIDKHLFALIDLCAERGVPRIAIHALLDGRDTMPRSGLGYMRQLLDYAGESRGRRESGRPLLRDGSRQAVGSHREVVSRRGRSASDPKAPIRSRSFAPRTSGTRPTSS